MTTTLGIESDEVDQDPTGDKDRVGVSFGELPWYIATYSVVISIDINGTFISIFGSIL